MKFDGYLEGYGYIVSWCVGHLEKITEKYVLAIAHYRVVCFLYAEDFE